jgi:DNA-binding transcriptional MocR family regulator
MPLTHVMLAELLGVRRASVTECLEVLQKQGTISTRRGWVTVEDPVALSKLCCDCFGLIEREYRRHLRSADPGHRRPDASAASAPTAALPRSKSLDRELGPGAG